MYRNNVDEHLISAFDLIVKGEFNKAENFALPFINSGNILQKNQTCLLIATCKFQTANFEGALKDLKEIDHWENKEALGLSAICMTHLGRIDEAESRFDKATSLEKGAHGYLTYDMVLIYLKALCNAGALKNIKKHIDLFMRIYASLGITDPTFLAIREIPPLEEFLIEVKKAVKSGYRDLDENDWLDLYLKVDDEGKSSLKELFILAGWTLPPVAP